jgi:CRISPR-associated endonuclease/helicase Cas3
MTTDERFSGWFERATGHVAYAYQETLATLAAPPSILELPTGSGKTQALLAAWLFQRQVGVAPRRLIYALPMRSLVEQTISVASEMRERLDLSEDELPIHVLMGGESPREDWRKRPEADQILVGTIDMLLSRALNRGYAESRFAWPVAFGLLNADCRWVFDEVQLMGPARTTSAQLDGLRAALGTALPCETVWVSATVDQAALRTFDRPDVGAVMRLPVEDRSGALRRRLQAGKILERVELGAPSGSAIAQAVLERHVPETRTLVVLNTVERAQDTYTQLARRRGERPSVLLHSRFRPQDRVEHMEQAIAESTDPDMIVVATQVIEAGVDLSCRTLVTEAAPFSSVVQRLGRCNRRGEHDEATCVWLDAGPVQDDAKGRKAAAPYAPGDVERTREALLGLAGASLSPAALERIEVEETADDPAVLRRRDLMDLFDTSPDLSGMDVDVAPWIREDDERTVAVFFRDLPKEAGGRITDQREAERAELVQAPRGSLGDRDCWMIDHVDGDWVRADGRAIPPGATVMLRAADGGYDPELGWDPKGKRPVQPISPEREDMPEGIESADGWTASGGPQELEAHLQDVATELARIADAIGLQQWRDVLYAAGALHDLGKAHPIFQRTLRRAVGAGGDDARLWAKSGARGAGHERRYFRHELASALAIPTLDGAVPVPHPDLAAYLVAAHHGIVRLSIRPAPDETRPDNTDAGARFALGVVDGDSLPAVRTPIGTTPAVTLDLAPMELGAVDSWTHAAARLRDDPALGPFRLGFLEALLRVADWRASSA